ncbi:MAG: ribonuclease III [Clostridia bacterium]|nr:ribonuclease III [Clostridia bacterium]
MSTTYPRPLVELERTLGYTFKNKMLLRTALTHSSFSNENKARKINVECNERLEFLGDSVLSIVVSEYLYDRFTKRPEGDLTKIRASVVCREALSKFAMSIGLGDYLLLGHGEELGHGRERPSILENAFEALLAAIFLDSGEEGKNQVAAFLLPLVIPEIDLLDSGNELSEYDHKTKLQQIVQQANGEILEYVVVGESGPDHRKIFEVEARLNSNVIGHGQGRTKREAEQNAAKEALTLFGEK